MNAAERIKIEAQLAEGAARVLARTGPCSTCQGKGAHTGYINPDTRNWSFCDGCGDGTKQGSGVVPVRDALTDALWEDCPCVCHKPNSGYSPPGDHDYSDELPDEYGIVRPESRLCRRPCSGLIPRTFDFGSGEFSGRVGHWVKTEIAGIVLKYKGREDDGLRWLAKLEAILKAAEQFDDPATLDALEAALKGVKP